MARKYRNLEERLIANSVVTDTGYDTPCWLYLGNLNANGYARLSIRVKAKKGKKKVHKKVLAHRTALEVLGGIKLTRWQQANHKCCFRACINPDHLEPSTPKQNSEYRDAMQKEKGNGNNVEQSNRHSEGDSFEDVGPIKDSGEEVWARETNATDWFPCRALRGQTTSISPTGHVVGQ